MREIRCQIHLRWSLEKRPNTFLRSPGKHKLSADFYVSALIRKQMRNLTKMYDNFTWIITIRRFVKECSVISGVKSKRQNLWLLLCCALAFLILHHAEPSEAAPLTGLFLAISTHARYNEFIKLIFQGLIFAFAFALKFDFIITSSLRLDTKNPVDYLSHGLKVNV